MQAPEIRHLSSLRTTGVEEMKKSMRHLKNEQGMATVETIPLLVIFVILLAYSFGSFGIIHTGILNSIAARTYAFETFRGRTNVTYFRDNIRPGDAFEALHFLRKGNRVHGIKQENPGNSTDNFMSTERPLRMGLGNIPGDVSRTTASTHNQKIYTDVGEQVQTQVGVSPVWIMTQYGICLNATCGGN
jgi:hypothetical protein